MPLPALIAAAIAAAAPLQDHAALAAFQPNPLPPASRAGEPVLEPATFHSLGVRWPVRGDGNANAVISVAYRVADSGEWRQALPLFRGMPGKHREELAVDGGWLFAGSVMDLAPGTAYQLRLTLADPDGGSEVAELRAATHPEPVAPPPVRVVEVAPGGLAAALAAAAPGDELRLAPGVYRGRFEITRSGAAGRPLVIRGPAGGGAVLDGAGGERLISANNARHLWLEGLTLQNARYLVVAHRGSDLVIRRNRFEVIHTGITAINGGYAESRHIVVTDNVFTGTAEWPRARGIEELMAVNLSGAGHVVAYNRMERLGDGIHGTGHGGLSASDYYNNDVFLCTDDGIETDYADTNVRVYRNRITNCFAGISAQPARGGPVYIWRNAIYNVEYSPLKLHNHTSGVIVLHNTSFRGGIALELQPGRETISNVVTRNNLFVGLNDYALWSSGVMQACDFDADGYGGFAGLFGSDFALYNGRRYGSVRAARRSGALYARHGATPVRVKRAFAGGLAPPREHLDLVPAARNAPLLAAGSDALDRGVPLPNINDASAGPAPDLGCCELGAPLPHYGPREQ